MQSKSDSSTGGVPAKVFCIGRNKTGTTSLEAALRNLGYRLGNQAAGEMLLFDWARRDFRRIIELCKTADAFQDIPFSLGYTYQAVDAAFPGSKFILTVRDDPEQWFDSVVRFHAKIMRVDGVPTAADLANHHYRYKGQLWDSARLIYGVDASTLYDKKIYVAHYLRHNQSVLDYFRHRRNELLILNVARADAMEKLCRFLGAEYRGEMMPHLNSSRSRD